MEIGFIGLGLMGRPMAQHLAAGGHRLHLWARRSESLAPFRDTGAVLHHSPANVAAKAEVVFTMVADSPDVRQVLLGADGLVTGAHPGLIVVDMSTIAPAVAREMAVALAREEVHFIDAPVSGGEKGAIEATLTIMAGGEIDVFERVLPLFKLMGKSVNYIGESGAGQVAKACNQVIVAATIAGVAEALNLARKSKVDAGAVRNALLGGFAYSRILENHGQRMLDGNFKPGFKAWMHQKDLGIVLGEAHRVGLPMPTTAGVSQLLNALVGSGLGEEDSIAIYKLLETMGG